MSFVVGTVVKKLFTVIRALAKGYFCRNVSARYGKSKVVAWSEEDAYRINKSPFMNFLS
jgi:hypothetical protein